MINCKNWFKIAGSALPVSLEPLGYCLLAFSVSLFCWYYFRICFLNWLNWLILEGNLCYCKRFCDFAVVISIYYNEDVYIESIYSGRVRDEFLIL